MPADDEGTPINIRVACNRPSRLNDLATLQICDFRRVFGNGLPAELAHFREDRVFGCFHPYEGAQSRTPRTKDSVVLLDDWCLEIMATSGALVGEESIAGHGKKSAVIEGDRCKLRPRRAAWLHASPANWGGFTTGQVRV
jgi:hypothetical protein